MTEPPTNAPEEKKRIDPVLVIAGLILIALAAVPILHAMRSRRGDSLPAPPRHLAPAASASDAPLDR